MRYRSLVPAASFFASFLIAAPFLLSSASAEFIYNSEIRHGNWQGGAYTSDETGIFTHCAISASYQSGDILVLTVSSDFSTNVSIANENWNLPIGERYEIDLYIDDKPPIRGIAEAVGPKQAIVQVDRRDGGLELLKRGYILNVVAGDFTASYRLDGTYVALSKASDCVRRHMNVRLQPSFNPNDGQAGQASGLGAGSGLGGSRGTAPQTGERREATQSGLPDEVLLGMAAQVLSGAVIRDFRFLTDAEKENGWERYPVVWIASDHAGTIISYPRSDELTLKGLADYLVSEDARRCGGEYATGSLQDITGSSLASRRVYTICRTEEDVYHNSYSLIGIGDYLVELSLHSFGDDGSGLREGADEAIYAEAISYFTRQ
ncbi:MAG: hypothetical protein R3245_04755 [Kiloniellales bacterium]|nr:hypothetical protein [Kiloniellales bacterium]